MRIGLRSALVGLLLIASSAAPAAWVKYEVTFIDPVPGGAFNGTGSFLWEDNTHVFNDFFWDFGAIGSGGFLPTIDWSTLQLGGTLGETLFEILTLQDIAPVQCDSVAVDCSITSFNYFGAPSAGLGLSIAFAEVDNVPEFRIGGGSFASFVTARPVDIPEPGTLLLVSLGICGIGALTRVKRA